MRKAIPTTVASSVLQRAFASVYEADAQLAGTFKEYAAARSDVKMALEEADPEMKAANNGAPPSYAFGGDATCLGTLMRRDPRVQLGFLAVSGWDTHAHEGGAKGQLANLLAPLAQGMAALVQSLGPAYADTAIAVISEFGRTVAQNGNGGTDHGHGNVMWLMGGNVAGRKVHGDWPGLDDAALYQGRDVRVTTDYRTVLAQLCEQHLLLPDAKLSDVFPAMPQSGSVIRIVRA
jgi:uncharacterized protein (DUF1501 family)